MKLQVIMSITAISAVKRQELNMEDQSADIGSDYNPTNDVTKGGGGLQVGIDNSRM
jgi:hypothetical protein